MRSLSDDCMEERVCFSKSATCMPHAQPSHDCIVSISTRRRECSLHGPMNPIFPRRIANRSQSCVGNLISRDGHHETHFPDGRIRRRPVCTRKRRTSARHASHAGSKRYGSTKRADWHADANASYRGTMSTMKASGASRDTWMTNPSTACVPGLSYNIYKGN